MSVRHSLLALLAREPLHGYGLKSGFESSTAGTWPLNVGQVYTTLRRLERDGLAVNAARTGAHLMEALKTTLKGNAHVGDIRGRGLVIGIELVGRDGSAAPQLARRAVYRAWELGLIAYYVGAGSNVIELTPPLILNKADADLGAARLGQAIADACAGRVDDAAIAAFQGW